MDKIQKNNKNPWKILSRKEVYGNQWMRIIEHEVIRPDGGRGIYAYMRCHPAIGIIPVDEEGYTWLVGQYRFPIKKYLWEIPSGMGEPGEKDEETAYRELREETGIKAGEMIKLGSFYTSNSLTDEEAVIFLARKLAFGATGFDETEELQIKKVSFSDIEAMIKSGEIKDSMSLIGLRWALKFLEKENDKAGKS